MTSAAYPSFEPPPILLRVPAEPSSLATVRTFASSAGRALGLDDGSIEDLRLILSELCADAVGGSAFSTTITEDGSRLQVRCEGPTNASGSVADRRRGILEAMIPDAIYAGDTVTFTIER